MTRKKNKPFVEKPPIEPVDDFGSVKEEIKEPKNLKQIALDIVENKIFHSGYIKNQGDLNMVFLPVALGAFDKTKVGDLEDIGVLYEYYDKAAPRSSNGYPIFFSFSILTKKECETVDKYMDEYRKFREQFMKDEATDIH